MTRRRVLAALLVFLLLGGVVGAAGVWFFFFSSAPPQAAALDDAADVVGSANPEPSATSAGSIDTSGTWVVDSSIGDFADFTNSYAGFRVDEVLQGIGETTAIGRTPDVDGSLTLDGNELTQAEISVGLASITSDQARRDPAIQRTLETGSYPTATFQLAQPIDLPSEPTEGVTYTLSAEGSMTMHGVTQNVTANLDARLVNGVIVVVGTVPFAFSDYQMAAPTAPIVLSVEDSGLIEFQLFFSR